MDEVQVCLWGDYNFKSYLPVINSNGSARLLVLAPNDQFQRITYSLSYKNIAPEIYEWPEFPTQRDFDDFKRFLSNLHCQNITFNLSGGKQYLLFSLYHFALENDYPCYLIDEEDIQHWLPPSDNPPVEVDNLASLKFYFKAHQITLKKSGLDMPITPELRKVTNSWANYPNDYGLFRTLNFLAISASPNLGRSIGTYSMKMGTDKQRNDLSFIWKDLLEAKLATVDECQLTLNSEAAKMYCNGGWLELYVYDQVRGLRDSLRIIQDVRLGLEIVYPEGIRNELDVVFLADNQLHIIEVKTSYLSNKIADANAIIYKLEALSSALGQEVKGMVISLFDLPNGALNRAGLYDIEIVSGTQIPQLQHHLTNWISQ